MDACVNRAGDLLKQILGDKYEEAQAHSALYSSWQDVVILAIVVEKRLRAIQESDKNIASEDNEYDAKNRSVYISAKKAADHSKIKDIQNGCAIVETDHPGWTQILQANQKRILYLLQKKQKNIEIRSLSFVLKNETSSALSSTGSLKEESVPKAAKPIGSPKDNNGVRGAEISYSNIKDEAMLQMLKNIEKTIAARADD